MAYRRTSPAGTKNAQNLPATDTDRHPFLAETGTISSIIEEEHEDSELIRLFYTKVTNEKMSGGETFVDYLNRFWDWNGDYVRSRHERKNPSA